MTTKTNTTQSTSWITIAIVIGVVVWAFKSCGEQQSKRDDEMRGQGMIEAKGFSGEFPPNAGRDYLMMLENSEYKSDDFSNFFRQLKIYNIARTELRKRGLNNSDLSKIPEWDLYAAMESASPEKELDRLAKQYD
jgi:hypothetical protein